jgi:putative hydrolase of the HAD superfamily
MIKYLLFDLDDTLYPYTAGLMQEISRRMSEYLMTRVGIAAADVEHVRQDYWNRYGTTLRGLYLEQHIDPQDFLTFVHDIPVTQILKPDTKLGAMLAELLQEKCVFTNSPADHVRRVLNALAIENLFTRIFDINFIEYESKPSPAAYTRVLSALDARGEECVLIDDTSRNLVPAQTLGMKTILVRGNPRNNGDLGADAVIETIYEISETLRRF